MADENNTDITALTVQLLSAFVSKNSVPSESLAELIKTTRAALTQDLAAPAPEVAQDHVRAVSVRKSIASPDHIISLIDGKPYKTLKRHLATNGLTPEQYRERYKLPKSYPLVAPNYSDARRAVAERLGLGRKTARAPATTTVPSPARPAPAAKAIAAPTPANAAVPKAAKKPAAIKAEAAPAPKMEMSHKTGKTDAKAHPRKRLSIAAIRDEKPAAPKAAKADAERSGARMSKPTRTVEPKAEMTKPKAASKPAAKPKAAKPAEAAANAAAATTAAAAPVAR